MSCLTRRSRGRNYEAELQKFRPEPILVEFGEYHPLKPIMVFFLCLSCSSTLIIYIIIIPYTHVFTHNTPLKMGLHLSYFQLSVGDWYKNPPWGPQRKYFLFLVLILCAHRSAQLHAWWDRSSVYVCSSISKRGSQDAIQHLRRGECKLQGYFDLKVLIIKHNNYSNLHMTYIKACHGTLNTVAQEAIFLIKVYITIYSRTWAEERGTRRKSHWAQILSRGPPREEKSSLASPPQRNFQLWVLK